MKDFKALGITKINKQVGVTIGTIKSVKTDNLHSPPAHKEHYRFAFLTINHNY